MNKHNYPVYSIFFHNYYGSHEFWIDWFVANIKTPVVLYYNIVDESLHNINASLNQIQEQLNAKTNLIKAFVARVSPNQGKDIGGKMILLDAYLRLDAHTEYGIFLHDKKSPYKVNNQDWTDKLLSIGNADFTDKALLHFQNNPSTGIIAAKGTLINEQDDHAQNFRSNNNNILKSLLPLYKLNPNSFEYLAGTMFWARMNPLEDFFSANNPLLIRQTFEKGNITDETTGSYTHSWERLLSWVITSQHYSIKTI